MIKLNEYQTMEMIFDLMSVHGLSFRNVSNHFFDSRVRSSESFLRTLDLLKEDINNKRKDDVIDTRDLHTDLIKEFCDG